jgi:hypothetical protein
VPDEQGDIVGVPDVSLPQNPSAVTTIPAGCASPVVPRWNPCRLHRRGRG